RSSAARTSRKSAGVSARRSSSNTRSDRIALRRKAGRLSRCAAQSPSCFPIPAYGARRSTELVTFSCEPRGDARPPPCDFGKRGGLCAHLREIDGALRRARSECAVGGTRRDCWSRSAERQYRRGVERRPAIAALLATLTLGCKKDEPGPLFEGSESTDLGPTTI